MSAASEERSMSRGVCSCPLATHPNAFKASPDMPWPSPAEYLTSGVVKSFGILTDFPMNPLSGKGGTVQEPKNHHTGIIS